MEPISKKYRNKVGMIV